MRFLKKVCFFGRSARIRVELFAVKSGSVRNKGGTIRCGGGSEIFSGNENLGGKVCCKNFISKNRRKKWLFIR